jgi:Flp pilus assembly protein TadG
MFSRRSSIRNQEGQAVAEFVLVLPALLLVLLAILQFGVLFKDYLALTDAVRAGARKGAVARHESNPKAYTEAAVRASADDLGPKLQVTASSSWTPGSQVEVVGRYPYKIKLLDAIVITDGWLESKTRERVE